MFSNSETMACCRSGDLLEKILESSPKRGSSSEKVDQRQGMTCTFPRAMRFELPLLRPARRVREFTAPAGRRREERGAGRPRVRNVLGPATTDVPTDDPRSPDFRTERK